MIKQLIKQMLPGPVWQSARRNIIRLLNQMILLGFRVFRGNREFVDKELVNSLRAEFQEEFDGVIDWRDEMYQIQYDQMTTFGTRSTMALYGEQRSKVQKAIILTANSAETTWRECWPIRAGSFRISHPCSSFPVATEE